MAPVIKIRLSLKRVIFLHAIATQNRRLANLSGWLGGESSYRRCPWRHLARRRGSTLLAFRLSKGTDMTIKIGNAPCSWGIEFPSDPAYPTWQSVLDQCAGAGYKGIELGPIGYMPEDPMVLAPALAERGP